MNSESVETLAAFAVPQRLPIENDNAREQRNWIVRCSDELPAKFNPDILSDDLTQQAALALTTAWASRGLLNRDLGAHMPAVKLIPFGHRHLVLNVMTVRLEDDAAHEYLIAAAAALTGLEKYAGVDEIQGIPRRFWKMLLG